MKRLQKFLMMSLSVAMLLIVEPLGAAEFTLTLHHFFSPKEPAQTKMLEPWANSLEKFSKGKVKINIAPGMSLGGKPSDLVKQAREGEFVDLIWRSMVVVATNSSVQKSLNCRSCKPMTP